MSLQQTSLIAYDELRQSGKFSERQRRVFDVIRSHQPHGITIRQIALELGVLPSDVTGAIDALKGDVDEGRPALITEGPKRPSPITGKLSIFWVPADRREVQLTFVS